MYFILCCAAADFLSLKDSNNFCFSLYLLIASANFKRLVVHQSSKSRSRHSCCSFQIAIWLLLLVVLFLYYVLWLQNLLCEAFCFRFSLICSAVNWSSGISTKGQALDGSISLLHGRLLLLGWPFSRIFLENPYTF